MKILLLGKNGQVGWELQRALSSLGDLIALDRKGSGSLCGDLANIDGLIQTVRAVKPDIIVNAAAFTAVDKAETAIEDATLINTLAPKMLAQEAAKSGAWLIHYSTDYVFNGCGNKAWTELDPTQPINAYGKSKLAGELEIRDSGCQHLIFRTSWVYGTMGNNFAKTILRLAQEREHLTIVADQIGVPTGADLLADLTANSIGLILKKPQLSGLYHVAPKGEISWHDYAEFVLKKAKKLGETFKVQTIQPIPSSDYSTPAERPLNSRLDTKKFTDFFPFQLPHWDLGVERMINEIFRKTE